MLKIIMVLMMVVICGLGSASGNETTSTDASVNLTGASEATPSFDSWNSQDAFNVVATGGDEMYLLSGLDKQMVISEDGIQNDVTSYLNADGVTGIDFQSSTYLTTYDAGVTTTTGSEISQALSLPGGDEFSVSLLQGHDWDISDEDDLSSIDLDTVMNILDPDGEVLFDMDNSFDDDVEDIINEALQNFGFGADTTIDDLKNLKYTITYNKPQSESSNGVTCEWGEAKNTVISLVK